MNPVYVWNCSFSQFLQKLALSICFFINDTYLYLILNKNLCIVLRGIHQFYSNIFITKVTLNNFQLTSINYPRNTLLLFKFRFKTVLRSKFLMVGPISEKCSSFKTLWRNFLKKKWKIKKLVSRRKTILIFPNKSSGFTEKLYIIFHGQ